MSDKNNAFWVNSIKQLANQMPEDCDDRVIVSDLIKVAEELKAQIDWTNSAFYIAVHESGQLGDSTEYYTPVGYTTRIIANRILNDISKDQIAGKKYLKEVSKEEYAKYEDLKLLTDIHAIANSLNDSSIISKSQMNRIWKKIVELRSDLGFTNSRQVIN